MTSAKSCNIDFGKRAASWLVSVALTLLAACADPSEAERARDPRDDDDGTDEGTTSEPASDVKRDAASGGSRADAASGMSSRRDASTADSATKGDAAVEARDAETDPERDAGSSALDGGMEDGRDAAVMEAAAPDDEVDVAVMGPYEFDTFTEGARAPEYAAGLVYYPTDAPPPFAAMVLSPGLTANNTDYEVWGRVLASHGIVVLLIQPTSTSDWNDARAVDLEAGLGVIKQLNESGPLASKLDTAHIGLMGQSMGGGGTLIAANKLGDQIQAAIPMQPYAPGGSFPNIKAPTLIIAAEADTVASVSSNAFVHYNSIPDSTAKIFLEGADKDHYFSTDRYENDFEINARYAVAFLKLYLEGDTRYEPYLYGPEHEQYQSGKLSRYLTSMQP